ncbi:MAG: hypothetical protein KJ732_02765, partial [Candidatus Margulisbacteria bacterium]|nr:hypothetical protein [Candidatus Margulisiibacteriota bacterium]
MKIINKLILAFILLAMVMAVTGRAVLYRTPFLSINVQGKISGIDIPTDRLVRKYITFKIYDAESGGTVLWSDRVFVAITNGYFDALLGTTPNPINIVDFWDVGKRYYIGVQVEGDPDEMSPRLEMVAVPFAMISR